MTTIVGGTILGLCILGLSYEIWHGTVLGLIAAIALSLILGFLLQLIIWESDPDNSSRGGFFGGRSYRGGGRGGLRSGGGGFRGGGGSSGRF